VVAPAGALAIDADKRWGKMSAVPTVTEVSL
jgi:hypothetical protein